MSVLVQLVNLSFSRPHKVLLRDLHLSIHNGDRIALVEQFGPTAIAALTLREAALEHLEDRNFRSYWDPGSFATSSSMSEPSNALPRLRTL